MAYTEGFDHDIFISFSHEDNLALEGEKGWVAQFRESLEVWLRRRGLRDLSIWWDEERLRGNTEFDARIEDSLAKTALLVVLHSRNYRQSDYCRSDGSHLGHNGGITFSRSSCLRPGRCLRTARRPAHRHGKSGSWHCLRYAAAGKG